MCFSVYLVEFQGGLAAVKIIARGQNIDGEQKYAVHFFEKGIKNPFYIRIRLTTQLEGQFILMMDYANLPALNHLMHGRIPPLPENVVGIFIRQIYYGLIIPESEAPSSKDVVGTPVYLAPEIVYLSPRYSHKSDTWAIGVMMFILLCRSYPFEGASTHQLYTSIQTKPHTITRRDLSQHCTDAINALLSKSPAQRPSAREALELPFFKQFEEDAKSGVTWSTFAQVTSGSFPKPPPQIFFIPDTHRTEQNYRHVSPLRRAQNRPSSHSQPASTSPYPASSPHDPTHPPSTLSADATQRAHPLPKNMPKHIQNGARFPARQSTGPAQVCEICGKTVPTDQMQRHKENEHKLSVSAPAAVPLPQLVPKNIGPVPPEAARLKFVGLMNPGLQCYLNIVVQSLFHIPLFRNILTSLPLSTSPSPRDPLHVGLHRLFQAMLDSQTPVNTSVFTQTIRFPQFDVRQMNDTQDFFNRLVNGLNSELKNTPLRGLASSLLSGRLVRKTTLEQSGRKSVSIHPEHFWSLRVPIELGSGVEDVLPKLLFPDQRGNTQKIYSLPPVLFVDLVRWTNGERGLMKNNKRFTFPTSLDLSRLIEPLTLAEKMNVIQKKKEIKKAKGQTPSAQALQSPQLQQSLAFNEPRHAAQKLVYSSELSGLGEPEKEQAWMAKQKTGPFYSQSFRYSLLAVEVHSGSLTMGHYYSFIRPLGTREWFECNDETIRKVEEREAIEGQFGGVVNGREVAHSAMSLVYVQDCHADKIAMKESTRVHPHPVPKQEPMQNQSELNSLRQKCDHLQSQLNEIEENSRKHHQVTDQKMKELERNLNKANEIIRDQHRNIEEEKRTASNNLEKEREVTKQLRLEHDKEKENMKKEMTRRETNHKDAIQRLEREMAEFLSDKEAGRELVTRLRSERDHANEVLKNYQARTKEDLDRLRQELEEQKRQTEAAQRTAAQLEDERRKIDEKLKDEERKRQELQREINHLTTQHQLEKNKIKEEHDKEIRERTLQMQQIQEANKRNTTLLEQNNKELRNQVGNIQKDLQTEKKKAELHQRTGGSLDEQIRKYQTMLSEVQSQLREAEKQVEDLQRERNQDKWEIDKLRSELEREKKMHEQDNKDLKKLLEVDALQNKIKAKQSQRVEENELELQIQTLQRELGHEREALKNGTQIWKTDAETHNVEITKLKDKIQKLEREMAQFLSDKEAGRELVTRLRSERDHANEALINSRTRTEKDLDRLRQELEEQKRQTKVAPRTATQSEEERREIDETLKDEERKRQELQREINHLTTQHQLEKNKIKEEHDKEIRERTLQMQQIQEANKRNTTLLEQNNKELRNQVGNIQKDLQTEQKQVKRLLKKLSEVQSLNSELSNTIEEKRKLEAKWKRAELEQEKRRQETSRLSSPKLDTEHRRTIESLKTELKGKNQEISELKRQLLKQAREHTSISNRNQTLESQIQAQERCHQKVLREYEQQSKQEQRMKTQHEETMFKLKNDDLDLTSPVLYRGQRPLFTSPLTNHSGYPNSPNKSSYENAVGRKRQNVLSPSKTFTSGQNVADQFSNQYKDKLTQAIHFNLPSPNNPTQTPNTLQPRSYSQQNQLSRPTTPPSPIPRRPPQNPSSPPKDCRSIPPRPKR
ncbi:putative Protein kinase domain containing protein [Blattamonas nauphoetae]|uniref:Uncharacterized protein n=1 Tax=Blattamonas nauphoetae TaxID=2049346 RepID=A0ABQ9XMT8_9EUKA|nr:putative Protein kinase domain containing protein [Blattamonas nauphoetae]